MTEKTWFGQRCFLCRKRFWSGGGKLRLVHADLEEDQEFEELPVCEPCSKMMDRVTDVGKAMRSAVDDEREG